MYVLGVRLGMSALPVLACFKSPIFLVKVRHDAPVLRIRHLSHSKNGSMCVKKMCQRVTLSLDWLI